MPSPEKRIDIMARRLQVLSWRLGEQVLAQRRAHSCRSLRSIWCNGNPISASAAKNDPSSSVRAGDAASPRDNLTLSATLSAKDAACARVSRSEQPTEQTRVGFQFLLMISAAPFTAADWTAYLPVTA